MNEADTVSIRWLYLLHNRKYFLKCITLLWTRKLRNDTKNEQIVLSRILIIIVIFIMDK